MRFDHIAILLDEPGAGTPEEGVGMFVNADGEQSEVENASIIDAANSTSDNLIDKVKFFFSNASQMSFDDIYQALRLAIKTDGDIWRYIVSVYPDHFIYEENGKGGTRKLFDQKYLMADGAATLVGNPVEVVRKPTEYEVKTNGETNPMKDMIINALQAAGKPTEGKSEAELLDAYNQMQAEKGKAPTETPEQKAAREKKEADDKKAKDTANNSDEMPAWAKSLSDRVDSVVNSLTANADKDNVAKRAAVKAKFNFDDAVVNAMEGTVLDSLYAKCQTSPGLNPGFQQNSQANDQWADYDLNVGMDQEKK